MINYSLISKAIKSYKKLGYQYIEVPWMVPKHVIDITLPPKRQAYKAVSSSVYADDDSYLVGSAEQSFLSLIIDKKLKDGKYVAASPCFRDEIEDKYHFKTFFKVELIHYCSQGLLSRIDLNDVILDAKEVLEQFTDKKVKFVHLEDNTYDLQIEGVEVGSYGLRHYADFNWIYGTGIAEPRFSSLR